MTYEKNKMVSPLKRITMKKIVHYTATLAIIAGCTQIPEQTPSTGEADVTFAVTLPAHTIGNSRATYADTDVENIDVLVFDHDTKFVKRVAIDQIEGPGAQKTFTLRMDYTPQACTFHIVANGREPGTDADRINFDAVTPGMLEANAIPLLRTNATQITEATITPLLMWGRAQVAAIDQPMIPITGTKLLRSQAAIVIRKADPTAENGLSKLNIKGVWLDNATLTGNLAPAGYSSSAAVPSVPSVPTGVAKGNYGSAYAPDVANPVLYAYECLNTAADPVSVVIKGFYEGDSLNPVYYSFRLIDPQGNYINLVRNHRYIITIIKVEGKGYPNEAEALDKPSNLKVEITDQFDTNFVMVSDGVNELGVSVNHLEFWGGHSNKSYQLATVYTSRTSQAIGALLAHSAFKSGGVHSEGNGFWTINSTWDNDVKGLGYFRVSDSSTSSQQVLMQNIVIETKELPPSVALDTYNTLVWKLFDETNKPWNVRIVENPERGRLSTSSAPASISTSWGSTSMNSNQTAIAYLHVTKNGDVVILEYECVYEGSLRVGRLYISK